MRALYDRRCSLKMNHVLGVNHDLLEKWVGIVFIKTKILSLQVITMIKATILNLLGLVTCCVIPRITVIANANIIITNHVYVTIILIQVHYTK